MSELRDRENTVALVEDDRLTVEDLEGELGEGLEGLVFDVVSTERAFYERMAKWESSPPSIFIIDVMLRWDDPSEHPLAPPPRVQSEGFFRAGLRCAAMLRE